MKKLGIILAILVVLSFAGCASSGGGGGGGEPPFIVDLSTLTQLRIIDQSNSSVAEPVQGLRNIVPFTRNWQGMVIKFPENFVDVSKYQRVTVTLRYFNSSGEELAPRDSMGMLVFIYDIKGDWHGPEMGAGPNTPLKEMNVGGFSAMVSTERGSRHGMNRAPEAIFIQKAQDPNVAFIELSGVIFHNANFKFDAPQLQGKGPEGTDPE
ncbi:MAG: hypothetical protein FWB86_09485 [Treponema sp.]|nr:hypothetical protein [Treponema sp.]MCL2252216.1 hypothetical protein [Treponema sp.]